MEVRIGVRDIAREISFESDQSVETVTGAVEAALRDGTVLSLTDDKGRRHLVPAAAIGYVNIGDAEKGRVGFGFQ
ncbi:MAG TPA: DUF3107 domain-containing protein [Dermatophilaceae bacterium]|nr:DUF3107 domain-containing protein [Dermatophilaceae bacterium]